MEVAIHDALQGLTIKDLRGQCRARGLNPAGSQEALRQRVTEHMHETNNTKLFTTLDQGNDAANDTNVSKNNYQRPGGNQNMGNRISDRPTSRVLAPPGGASQIMLGDAAGDYHAPAQHSHNPAAVRAAEQVLSRMGLGDTDQLVSNANPSAQQFYQMASPPPAHAPSDVSRGQQGASQLSFGDYRLPSTVAKEGPEHVYSKSASEKHQEKMVLDVDAVVKPLMMKDLRSQCRIRGLSPAGGMDQLRQRLGEHMISTQDIKIYAEGGAPDGSYGAGPQPAPPAAAYGMAAMEGHARGDGGHNNYARPSGMQNVGNFITDRPSSRVLAPPGGSSQIIFGQAAAPRPAPPPVMPAPYANSYEPSPVKAGGFGASTHDVKSGALSNNYSRPGGQQNVGNFITDRPSSRVLAPPGGKSQITFG